MTLPLLFCCCFIKWQSKCLMALKKKCQKVMYVFPYFISLFFADEMFVIFLKFYQPLFSIRGAQTNGCRWKILFGLTQGKKKKKIEIQQLHRANGTELSQILWNLLTMQYLQGKLLMLSPYSVFLKHKKSTMTFYCTSKKKKTKKKRLDYYFLAQDGTKQTKSECQFQWVAFEESCIKDYLWRWFESNSLRSVLY